MGRKLHRAAVPLSEELGPHLTQCGQGRGLPGILIHPSSHLATTDIGRKLGAVPL